MRWLATKLLGLFGWQAEIIWPPEPKAIIIVYPHTSNWDFIIGYLAMLASGIPAEWIGKASLFRPPFGALLRRMGGIPVNRGDPQGLVGQLALEIERRPRMWLALAPEGTRAYTDHWKSGFYRLALATNAPVGLAFIDYRTRRAGLSTYVKMTGDREADMQRLRAYYAGMVGKHPAQAGKIRFRPDAAPHSHLDLS